MPDPTPKPVDTPAGFVPLAAIAFGATGASAVPVDTIHPLPVADQSYRGAVVLTPDQDRPAGRALLIDCTSGGRAALRLADGSELDLPVSAGLSVLPFAVRLIAAAGTTATASFWSLT